MSAVKAFPTTGARDGRKLVALFSILSFATALHLAGCSGGGDGGGAGARSSSGGAGSSGAPQSYDEAREAAEAALEKAKAADAGEYFPDKLQRAEKRLDEAEDLILSGSLDDATRQYILAKNTLESLAGRAEEVASALEKVEPVKKEAEEARKKAGEAQAAENAPEDLREAERIYELALASYEEPSKESARQARQEFRQAVMAFEEAARRAQENAITRRQALRMKERMATYKEQARANDAHTKALLVWQNGESAELRADGEMERGNFQRAVQLFEQAMNQYTAAVQRVMSAEEFAKLQKEQLALDEKRRQEEIELRKEMMEQIGKGRTTPAQPTASSGSGTFQPGRGVVQPVSVTASCFDGLDFSVYSDTLDAEREAYLQKHLSKLSPIGAPTYDPATGQILLDYQIGRTVRREVNTLKTSEEYLEWEDWMASQYKTVEELKKAGSFAIGGNTNGFVLFPIPFQNGVRVTFDMNLLTMSGGGDFGVVLNFADGAYFRTNFLDIGFKPARGPIKWKRRSGKYAGTNANYWVNKTRHITWEIVYRMPDPSKADEGPLESSLITVTYDLGRQDELKNSISAGTALTAGFVGLTWTQVKFRLFNLQICGIMDRDATIDLLPLNGAPEPPPPAEEPSAATTASSGDDDSGGDEGEVETTGGEIDPVEKF